MAKSRLIGDYPVIGIRPTIDGRRGALKVNFNCQIARQMIKTNNQRKGRDV